VEERIIGHRVEDDFFFGASNIIIQNEIVSRKEETHKTPQRSAFANKTLITSCSRMVNLSAIEGVP
jgi:hypothetical protein